MARIELKMGDEVDILGHWFVLVKLEVEAGKPAKVTFAQPSELIEVVEYCALDFGKAHASYHPWCTDHDLPAIHRDGGENHQVCQEFAKKYGCSCHADYYKEN
jgi:hypothetical protein